VRTARRLSLAFGVLGAILCASALFGLRGLETASDAIGRTTSAPTSGRAVAPSVRAVRGDLDRARAGIYAALAVGLVVAAGSIFSVRKLVGAPVRRLLTGIERFRDGDLEHRIPAEGAHDYADLASSINRVIAQRSRVHEELELLRKRDELVLAAVGEGIFALDADGGVTVANPAAARMLGRSLEELVGKPHHNLVHHSQAGGSPLPETECAINLTLADGEARYVDGDVFWRKDGSSFAVEYTCTPLVEDVISRGVVILFRDVTERRAVERMKDEFVSIVSHELRTPLTSIKGSLGLIASGMLGDVPERGRRMLDIAISNSERLVHLINDILDIEKLDSGGVIMNLKPCNAADLMTQAVETIRPLAMESGVTVAVTPMWAQLSVDPDRIQQALTNLLSNAIKFSDWGGRVWVSAERRDGELQVEVRDQGRGIPPHHLETIFERFQQVDASDSREKGGTGLGLSICRSIVKKHRGRIWAMSVLGKGSTFYFTLPLAKADASGFASGYTSNRTESHPASAERKSDALERWVR
jgi:PAS domain S-box-containing protein